MGINLQFFEELLLWMFLILGRMWLIIVKNSSDFAKKFYDVLMNEGAEKWDMNVAYTQFKKELKQKKDNSIVYFCDESNNAQ